MEPPVSRARRDSPGPPPDTRTIKYYGINMSNVKNTIEHTIATAGHNRAETPSSLRVRGEFAGTQSGYLVAFRVGDTVHRMRVPSGIRGSRAVRISVTDEVTDWSREEYRKFTHPWLTDELGRRVTLEDTLPVNLPSGTNRELEDALDNLERHASALTDAHKARLRDLLG